MHKLRCRSEIPRTRSSSHDRPNIYQLRRCSISHRFLSVLNSLPGHGQHSPRRKLYSILEHRIVILQWIPADCGIKGNDHADGLAKQGANMEQKTPNYTQAEKNNNEDHLQSKEDTR